MWLSKGLALFGVLLVLTGCGFRPLYGYRDGARLTHDLAAIEINPIPERLGVVVYNHLRDSINPKGQSASPTYRLAVELQSASRGLVTEKDSQIRRFDLLLFANYELLDHKGGAVFFQGEARGVASYNVVEDANFATLAARQDAGERAAKLVSDQIVQSLGLFLREHPSARARP